MNLRSVSALAAACVIVGGGLTWRAAQAEETARLARASAAAGVAADLAMRTADIGFFEARVARDPEGAMDRATLAALFLQRARETNDYEDYLRAESAARASLALRSARNAGTYAVLASALLAQHRFADARDVARQLVAAEPTVDSYRALLGETCLEIGDYTCAGSAFDGISPAGRASLAVAPRLARWAETRGDTASARRIFRRVVTAAVRIPGIPREQAAWFHLRAADLELRQGRVAAAERAVRAGLAVNPGDHRLLAAGARVAAVRQDWTRAIQYGDSAIAISLDPATLGIISDAYAAQGDSVRASEYFTAMEVAVGQQPGAFHRAWSLYLLDHGRRVSDVLAAAQEEIVGRPDVYGQDLLAWALHKSGRTAEARVAIRAALAQGTQDAMLLYHAGMIEAAAGDASAARSYLQRALAVSPFFHHAAPAIARAMLDSLPRVVASERQ